jgi:porin
MTRELGGRSRERGRWSRLVVRWTLVGAWVARAQTFAQQDALTGNWDGWRANLANRGVVIEAVYTGEVFANVAGGVRREAGYLDNVDLTLAVDAEKLLGWPETSLFVYGLGDQGDNPSKDVGDAQRVSNIAAYNTWKLYEAWVERRFSVAGLSVLAGLYDLNSEFDELRSASVFLKSSHGIDPTFALSGRNGPSIFPTTTLGLRLKWEPAPRVYLQTVVLNGLAGNPHNPSGTQLILNGDNGVLWTTEAGVLWWRATPAAAGLTGHRRLRRFAGSDYDAKVAVGTWYYTASLDAVASPAGSEKQLQSLPGVYGIAEKSLTYERADPAQGLTAFARLGWADPRVNRFTFYAGGGLTYCGLVPGRDRDMTGLAVACAFNGHDYRFAQERNGERVDRAETDMELTYAAPLTGWLTVQPDLQYVINPNTDPSRPDALAVDLRFVVTF